MFEAYVPQRKIGYLSPLPVIDNGPYEFYQLVPKGIMMVLVPVGLQLHNPPPSQKRLQVSLDFAQRFFRSGPFYILQIAAVDFSGRRRPTIHLGCDPGGKVLREFLE